MRFECDSCHAKYKISDEKVRGRVVRFPCRKCDHKILIDGRRGDPEITVPAGAAYGFEEVTRKSGAAPSFGNEAPTARARRPSSPVRRRPPSVPPRRPSSVSRRLSSAPAAASSALVGQHPGLAPPVPVTSPGAPAASVEDVAEWHVSINDVPLGPIRLEEISHKIDAGAVSEYTLVWREGLDEWRPLATVPELMALLHERRHSGPPPRTSFSSMPPFVDSHTLVSEPPAHEDAPADFTPLADSLQPEPDVPGVFGEVSQPPAQIGPAGVFESSPQLGSFSGLPAAPDEQVSVPAIPPQGAVATVEPRRGMSLGILAIIVAVVVFSGVAAFLAFEKFGDSLLQDLLSRYQPVEPVAAPIAAPPAEEPEVEVEEAAAEEVVAAEGELEEGEQLAEGEEAEASAETEVAEVEVVQGEGAENENTEAQAALAVEPVDPADDGPKMTPARPRKSKVRRAPRPKPVAAPAKGDSLSDEDQKLINEFGSSADAAPAQIDVKESGSTQSKNPPLDGDAVRATVTTNKPRLQRCYERAIRGQQSPPSVRLDVSVMVSASGRVKKVNAAGNGPGGLAECIEASVRRWRFPASSEGGPAKFPIVFSAN